MGVVALLSKPKKKNPDYQPFVSVIVPAYNEERVISERIRNLFELDYPKDKYEIIVVESGSQDNTRQVVEDIIERNVDLKPSLRLAREPKRAGKASAINLGKRIASGNIVLVTDANSIFDKNVLKEIMPNFADSRVGAVGGRDVDPNPDTALAAAESFYLDLEYIIRRGESALDSACLFPGELNAWRKDIVEADTKNLTEDLDMAIQIRRAGYKIEYEPKAVVYEPMPTTAREQVIQRKRTSIGTMQCIFKHLDYFLLPRDLYSLLIFPSHKILAVLSPLLLLAILILYFIAWNGTLVAIHFFLTLLVSALMFGTLLLLRRKLMSDEEMKVKCSLLGILKIGYYVLLTEYLLLLAWKDFLFKKYSVLWQKVETTRR